MNKRYVLFAIVLLIVAFFGLGGDDYLSLSFFNSQRELIEDYIAANALLASLLFFIIYVAVTALSLPGAAVLTLIAGALFGFWQGLVLVSFASSIGALLAFIVARLLFKEAIQQRFAKQLSAINQGIEQEGSFYLFTLRLIPLFPFFVINLLMGLTPIKAWTFYWVSQLGMLAGTAVYVNAGMQLAQLESVAGILSAELILAFSLLGLFPLLTKKLMDRVKASRVYKQWPKPKRYDYNLVVIGAGAGGLVSAYIAAAVKAKVLLIEKHQMGGDCLNTGCVPSKALIRSAKLKHQIAHSEHWAISAESASTDLAAVMARVNKVIQRIEPHDSVERYQGLGVEVEQGRAELLSPFSVRINNRVVTTKNIIVATGASPFVPPIEGLDQIDYLTSENIWQLQTLPKRLLVLGGGPIGCELAQAFSRLGAEVTQVEMASRLMVREDEEVSSYVQEKFLQEGITVLTASKALQVLCKEGEKSLLCEREGQELEVPFDALLIAVGRKPNVQDFGLEALKIPLNDNGTIKVNKFQQTIYPNVLAVGDVAGPYQFTHTAAHQAWYASVNALFGVVKKFSTDYSVIPRATFVDPEVASVGLNEQQAQQQGIAYQLSRYDIDDLDRAIADGQAKGFIKVLTPPGKDTILGVTIVAANAGDLIAEFVLAMKHGLGLNKILGTIHTYPTMMEANKFVAGQWKQANKPEGLLNWLEKWHQWRRH